jgi:hypothetical protein
MKRGGSLRDLVLDLVGIFADHPPPPGCRHETWRRMEKEAFHLHERVVGLQDTPPAPVEELHVLARSTARCHRFVSALDGRDPLVQQAITCLTEIVRGLEAAARGVGADLAPNCQTNTSQKSG